MVASCPSVGVIRIGLRVLDAKPVTHTFGATHATSVLDCNNPKAEMTVSVAIQVSVDGGVHWDTQAIGSKTCFSATHCAKTKNGPCNFSGQYRNVATAIITGGGSIPNDVSPIRSFGCP